MCKGVNKSQNMSLHRGKNCPCSAIYRSSFNEIKHENLWKYRHQYANIGQKRTGKREKYEGAQAGYEPSKNSSSVQKIEKNMKVLCHVDSVNRKNDNFKEVVY